MVSTYPLRIQFLFHLAIYNGASANIGMLTVQMMCAVELSLRVVTARVSLCRHLAGAAVPVTRAMLQPAQFELIVRLLNCALEVNFFFTIFISSVFVLALICWFAFLRGYPYFRKYWQVL